MLTLTIERPIAIPIKPTLDCLQNLTLGEYRTYKVPDILALMSNYLEWQTGRITLYLFGH